MSTAQFHTKKDRWAAVCENNKKADGHFYYAVITTGIYCRPSCTSKLPKKDNVEFFVTSDDAESAGYRACKRCKPNTTSKGQETKQKIIDACRIIEKSESPVTLDELATKVNLSPYHFHRIFKKMVGVTPKQYGSRHQSQRFQENLIASSSVTDAIYSSGYSSSGGAYDQKRDQLGMQPKTFRSGAEGIVITYGVAQCFLGCVIVAATNRGICAIEFGDDAESLRVQLQARFPKADFENADNELRALIKEVIDFIEKPQSSFQLPLDIQGTAFQQKVWEVLRQIKPGQTMSYAEVAQKIGSPKAARAVAIACSANRLAVVVPCHRVIAKNDKLSGYRWGVKRKKRLLDNEKKIVK